MGSKQALQTRIKIYYKIYFDTPASHYKHTYTFTTSHYLTTLHYLTSIYFLGLAPTIAQQTVSLWKFLWSKGMAK